MAGSSGSKRGNDCISTNNAPRLKETEFGCKRVRLSRVFTDSRDYLFRTDPNIRSFEWEVKEADALFESVSGVLDEDHYEQDLGTMTLVERELDTKEAAKRNLGVSSNIYDVSISCDVQRIQSSPDGSSHAC